MAIPAAEGVNEFRRRTQFTAAEKISKPPRNSNRMDSHLQKHFRSVTYLSRGGGDEPISCHSEEINSLIFIQFMRILVRHSSLSKISPNR
jgi:hypothetical protein